MSKNRVADVFKTDELIFTLRRRIKSRSGEAARLVARIRLVDPTSAKLPSLRGHREGIEAKLIRDRARLKSMLSERQQLVLRARKELEANTGKHKKWVAAQRDVTSELRTQVLLLEELKKTPVRFGHLASDSISTHEYELFISHASEDKEDFVGPLAAKLVEVGVRVWYDELSLSIGDSLRKAIDYGLSRSRFGLVVLSSAFFARNWTQYELNGLISREMEGAKVILPIWHKVTKDEVMKFSPTLVDKVALNSAFLSIDELATKLLAAVRPQ